MANNLVPESFRRHLARVEMIAQHPDQWFMSESDSLAINALLAMHRELVDALKSQIDGRLVALIAKAEGREAT